MRILEGMRLRTKDVDFKRGAIIVREAKGVKDRAVMLPRSLRDELKQQLRLSHALWKADRAAKLPGVEMPHAFAVTYLRAGESCGLHCVFPQASIANGARTGVRRRHHAQCEGDLCAPSRCSVTHKRRAEHQFSQLALQHLANGAAWQLVNEPQACHSLRFSKLRIGPLQNRFCG